MMSETRFKAGAPEGGVDVVGHRGASAYAPENTLASFKLAIDMEAHWFELDCTLTKDGEVIVIHDDTTERTTGVHGRVQDMTLSELKRLDAGSWFDPKFAGERLPTLGETLELVHNRIGVYIEIKNSDDDSRLQRQLLDLMEDHARLIPEFKGTTMTLIESSGSRNLELTRKVIREVRHRRMNDQIVIQSFSPVVCAVALIEAPELSTALLGGSSEKRPEQWGDYLRWVEILNVPAFNVDKKDVTASLVADLHKAGRTIAVWTVNEENDVRRFAQLGVDALITDHPDRCLNTLATTSKPMAP